MTPLQNANIFYDLPLHIISLGRFNSVAIYVSLLGTTSAGAAAWPNNDLAIYTPMSFPIPFTVARFMVANGSNLTGNVDVGLYRADGARLLSTGTTARASASAVQYIDVTNTVFQPGHYYLGMVASSTTGTYSRATAGTAFQAREAGMLQEQLGSTVLPATMTPVGFTGTMIPRYGFTQSDTL